MKDVAIKAVVTGPDFYYREEHEWKNLHPEASAWFDAANKKIAGYIAKASSNKQDDGLVAVLSATVDGKTLPDVNVSGISYQELSHFQRMWQNLSDEIIGKGESGAHDKDKKRHGHR